MKKIINVLCIDDSRLVRRLLRKGLSQDDGINVIDTAADVYEGRDKLLKYRPDVLTLDLEMPKMDGLSFLKKLMPQYPIPVIIVSSLSKKGAFVTLQAIEMGAVDYITKPINKNKASLNNFIKTLQTKVKIASTANVSKYKHKKNKSNKILNSTNNNNKLIVIGASTGGTEATRKILTSFPRNMPPIIVSQHMPPKFTKYYADNLNKICDLEVREAQEGDIIEPGLVLISPGDYHCVLKKVGFNYKITLNKKPKLHGQRPAIDYIMKSVARCYKKKSIGIILTGMGKDGAEGLLAMKKAGASTITQNEATSVVYSMPKIAYEIGASDVTLPIENIAQKIIKLIK